MHQHTLRKTLYMAIAIVPLLILSSISYAQQKAQTGLTQLRTNVDNSQFNFQQYEKNAEISQENVREISRAIIDLDNADRQLLDNHKNLDQNKATLKKVQEQIEGFKVEEQARLETEQKQLEELLARVNQIKQNQEKRKYNIAAYEKRVQEINQEIAEWDQQNKSLAELQRHIASKRTEAVKEREQWEKKRDSYQAEARKWKDEHQEHRKTLQEYQHLVNN